MISNVVNYKSKAENKREKTWSTIKTHSRTNEYGTYIIEAIEINVPFKFSDNVLNTGGLIENLPREACVEVPCIADASGIEPGYVGRLPE